MRSALKYVIAALVIVTGLIVAPSSPLASAAAPTVSAGCNILNDPAYGYDGTYIDGSISGHAFNRNDLVTVTASGIDVADINALKLTYGGTLVDSDNTSPLEVTYRFVQSGNSELAFFIDSKLQNPPDPTWSVTCVPSTGLYSNTCAAVDQWDEANGGPRSGGSISGAGFDTGEVVVVSANRANTSDGGQANAQFKLQVSGPGGLTTVAGPTGIPGWLAYTAPAGATNIGWTTVNPPGGNALFEVSCHVPATASENRVRVYGIITAIYDGQPIATAQIETIGAPGALPGPTVAANEAALRAANAASGNEGPITCTSSFVPGDGKADAFRNNTTGSEIEIRPPSDDYIAIDFEQWTNTCTQAVTVPCGPGTPTPAGYKLVEGTNGNDNLIGGSGNTFIRGLGGNDSILDVSGNDIICGGPGDDNISAGGGNDNISGGTGNDQLAGGSGTDRGVDADPGTRRSSIELTS